VIRQVEEREESLRERCKNCLQDDQRGDSSSALLLQVVIGGYTLPEGNRRYFGSLLVGYQGPDGLLFAGRVETGFSEKLLASIDAQLQKLRRATCPFINLPEKSRGGAQD
jgi:ATP-dependent DNA ligase